MSYTILYNNIVQQIVYHIQHGFTQMLISCFNLVNICDFSSGSCTIQPKRRLLERKSSRRLLATSRLARSQPSLYLGHYSVTIDLSVVFSWELSLISFSSRSSLVGLFQTSSLKGTPFHLSKLNNRRTQISNQINQWYAYSFFSLPNFCCIKLPETTTIILHRSSYPSSKWTLTRLIRSVCESNSKDGRC